jgi:hypothetical protein
MTDSTATTKRVGRPTVPYTCHWCLRDFPAGKISKHQTTCPSNPAIIRKTKLAELEAYMAPIEHQAAQRFAAVSRKAVC